MINFDDSWKNEEKEMEGDSPLQTSSSSIVVLESVDSLTWDPSPFLAIILLPAGVKRETKYM